MNTSRFFVNGDAKVLKMAGISLHPEWWSRPFEYAWAGQFAKAGDTVLDAACGICHPFKFDLAGLCKVVHAVDIDERISDRVKMASEIKEALGEAAEKAFWSNKLYDSVKFKQASIKKLPHKNSMFNTIFCISVLEHFEPADRERALKEFYRTLKSGGRLILTLDHPTADPQEMAEMVTACGFSFAGEVDFTIPEDAVASLYLRCYRIAAVKR
jgi:ubiquinone/menaquinone biosynthesis C-methylase UbiE